MSRVATAVLVHRDRHWSREWAKQAAIVISASLFVAVCARLTVPLPYTPVPLTLSNFAVLAVGLLLGSRRGFAALALYLIEGAFGLPVFSPSPLGGGIAQILGPTGGFLMAYPVAAFVAGWTPAFPWLTHVGNAFARRSRPNDRLAIATRSETITP